MRGAKWSAAKPRGAAAVGSRQHIESCWHEARPRRNWRPGNVIRRGRLPGWGSGSSGEVSGIGLARLRSSASRGNWLPSATNVHDSPLGSEPNATTRHGVLADVESWTGRGGGLIFTAHHRGLRRHGRPAALHRPATARNQPAIPGASRTLPAKAEYTRRKPATPAQAGNSRRQPEAHGASRQLPAHAGYTQRHPKPPGGRPAALGASQQLPARAGTSRRQPGTHSASGELPSASQMHAARAGTHGAGRKPTAPAGHSQHKPTTPLRKPEPWRKADNPGASWQPRRQLATRSAGRMRAARVGSSRRQPEMGAPH